MNTIDRSAINDLTKLDKVKNTTIRTYIALVSMSKMNRWTQIPTIEDFTVYKLTKQMKDKMPNVSASGVRLGVKKLFEVGFIAYTDEHEIDLMILNNGNGWIKSDENYKSEGYIQLHHFFFERVFSDLSLPAKKLTLELCSRIDGIPDKEVILNFKSKKSPEEFGQWCKKLNVNRLAHIKGLLKELSGIFNVVELDNNSVRFSLKRISEALITGTDDFLSYTGEQLEKTREIIREENTKKLDFTLKQIKAICSATIGYTLKVRRNAIKELCKNCRRNVKNMFGYARKIIRRINCGVSYFPSGYYFGDGEDEYIID